MSDSNPYAAPRAEVADVAPERHGRPVLVWIIVIFTAIGVVSGTITAAAALLGSPIGGPEAAAYTRFLTPLDHFLTLALLAVNGFGAVELFRLKRRALPIFVATFLAGLAIVALNFSFRPDYRAMFDFAGYASVVIGWVVNLAIIGYLWRLTSKGVLRA